MPPALSVLADGLPKGKSKRRGIPVFYHRPRYTCGLEITSSLREKHTDRMASQSLMRSLSEHGLNKGTTSYNPWLELLLKNGRLFCNRTPSGSTSQERFENHQVRATHTRDHAALTRRLGQRSCALDLSSSTSRRCPTSQPCRTTYACSSCFGDPRCLLFSGRSVPLFAFF